MTQATLTATAAPRPQEPPLPRWRLALVREADSPYAEAPPALGNAEQVAQWAQVRLASEPHELMMAVYTDTKNRVIGYHVAYRGTISRAAVEPRGILVPALLANATNILLIHNHPSGDPSPSAEDLAFTARLAEAAWTVGIPLQDHLIIGYGPGRFTSLRRRDENLFRVQS